MVSIQRDVIRRVEPDSSGPVHLRAVRPDGNVLIEELASPGHSGYAVSSTWGGGGPPDYAIGAYEWQQRIGEDWVTLSRYEVTE
jgi:hypothetical protein